MSNVKVTRHQIETGERLIIIDVASAPVSRRITIHNPLDREVSISISNFNDPVGYESASILNVENTRIAKREAIARLLHAMQILEKGESK